MTEPRTCPWCAAPATEDATRCSSCDAVLAQRESIGDLVIPGLTAVDPALEDFDKRPLHLGGPSPSHGMAPALIVAAAAGGPIGLAAIGGVAALAAVELRGASRDRTEAPALADVGRPSEVVLRALEHLGDDTGQGEAATMGLATKPVDDAAPDDGRSIWRDLPPAPAGPDDDAEAAS